VQKALKDMVHGREFEVKRKTREEDRTVTKRGRRGVCRSRRLARVQKRRRRIGGRRRRASRGRMGSMKKERR
jgi:hypothetical protein